MGAIFSKPETPAAPPPPPPPSPVSEDPTVRAATNEALRREQAAQRNIRGRASTLLTGGQGVSGDPNVARRALLGS